MSFLRRDKKDKKDDDSDAASVSTHGTWNDDASTGSRRLSRAGSIRFGNPFSSRSRGNAHSSGGLSPNMTPTSPTGASYTPSPTGFTFNTAASTYPVPAPPVSEEDRMRKSPAGPTGPGDDGTYVQPPPAYQQYNPQDGAAGLGQPPVSMGNWMDLPAPSPAQYGGNPFQDPSASTTFVPAIVPTPAGAPTQGLTRAGTYDQSSGAYRGLGNLEGKTAPEIRALLRGIPGINVLKECDTIIGIDNSTSMGTNGYWALVEPVLGALAPIIAAYDSDGYSAYVLNSLTDQGDDEDNGIAGGGYNGLTTAAQIKDIFKNTHPVGTTPIHDLLRRVFSVYGRRLSRKDLPPPKPLNFIMITDGSPDEPHLVKKLIEKMARTLKARGFLATQVGIQFLQIGNMNAATAHIRSTYHANPRLAQSYIDSAREDLEQATAFLQDLDDFMGTLATDPDLEDEYDIVDTKNADDILKEGGYDPIVLVRIVVGALVKTYDRYAPDDVKERIHNVDDDDELF